jgi:cytochrome c biogenesis protein CcdA
MVSLIVYIGIALYLGILTSISPCPLATNIAAISYIGRKVDQSRLVIQAGLLYTLGRCLLYLLLAVVVTKTALSLPATAVFLQSYMHLVLGPIFLLLGMLLVGLISVSLGGPTMSDKMQQRVDAMGVWGALFLGVLFALTFCPTSVAWFFGLLTLTLGSEAGAIDQVFRQLGVTIPTDPIAGGTILLPLVYGVGTALPVLVVAFFLAYSANLVGRTYNVLARTEWWARMATGWIFIIVGAYFSLHYLFLV